MNTATHSVVVPFPQAFAEPESCLFPSAPGTGNGWLVLPEAYGEAIRQRGVMNARLSKHG